MSAKGESTLASCTERGVASKEELLAVINMVMRNSKAFWICAHYKTTSKPVGELTVMAEMLAAK